MDPASEPPETIERTRDRVRAAYSQGLDDMLGMTAAQFLLPDDAVLAIYDFVQFAVFNGAKKIVEARHQPLDRQNLMAAYWPMQKALKDEVPAMLRMLADEAERMRGEQVPL